MTNPQPTVQRMTEPHKRPHRHPKYKTAYRVKNWREYDKSLRDRGDLTLWISQDAIDAWTPPQTGKRGALSQTLLRRSCRGSCPCLWKGLGSQGVEQFGRSAALFSSLQPH